MDTKIVYNESQSILASTPTSCLSTQGSELMCGFVLLKDEVIPNFRATLQGFGYMEGVFSTLRRKNDTTPKVAAESQSVKKFV